LKRTQEVFSYSNFFEKQGIKIEDIKPDKMFINKIGSVFQEKISPQDPQKNQSGYSNGNV
jgi:hypothetical protein